MSMGVPVRGAQDAQISLWHPLQDPSETVLAWRRFLETHGVRQPFKQAHREVLRAGAEDGALAYHPKRMMWARPDPGTV